MKPSLFRSIVLSAVCIAALAACATPAAPPVPPKAEPVAAPEPAKPVDTSALSRIKVVRSESGVTAWLVEEPTIPIIAVNMAWRGGESSDPAGKQSLAWMLSYLMNEGAGDLDSAAFGERMEDLNMSFGCSSSADWTSCSMSGLSEKRDGAFALLESALEAPRFDGDAIDRAKRELIVGLKQAETRPGTIAARAMNAALIPGHPYSAFATQETVSALTREDIVAFKSQVMTRDRLLVTIVGDITEEEVRRRLDEIFGALPATSQLPEPPGATANAAPAQPIVKALPQPQTLVVFSAPGPERHDPDFYAATVLNYILGGGGFSSRLMDEIREKRGLTYGISTGLSTQRHLSRWTGSAQTRNETAMQMVSLVKDEIGRLATGGATQQELDDAKSYLVGAYPLRFDSNAKIASILMGVQQDGLGPEFVLKRNDLISQVTLADLKRVADTYLKPEAFTFVLVGKPS